MFGRRIKKLKQELKTRERDAKDFREKMDERWKILKDFLKVKEVTTKSVGQKKVSYLSIKFSPAMGRPVSCMAEKMEDTVVYTTKLVKIEKPAPDGSSIDEKK